MLNKEKYREEIAKMALDGEFFAISKLGVPMICNYNVCEKCKFFIMQEASAKYKSCKDARKDWLNDEFQGTDWTKVPVDTKILVRTSKEENWKPRFFAKYENGFVYAYRMGCTSWSIKDWGTEHMTKWNMAKLAETEQGDL